MAKITEKENFLRVINGEEPAWVPRYVIGAPDPYSEYPPCNVNIGPSFLNMKTRPDGTLVDIFGVEYTPTESTGGAALPTPNKFILDDIRKWRDVIKLPSLDGIDWESMARKDLENVDRENSAVLLRTHVGYFQHIMNFMGFNNGLASLVTDPDEVLALIEYLAEFYDEVERKCIYYYKPDMVNVTDDNATSLNPFISHDMYVELFKPYQMRQGKIAMEAGLYLNMHDCGRCEDFIDDWLEFGVRMWNPAQVTNDLKGIKKKYGNKLVLAGCWDSQGPAGWPDTPEEEVRAAVRECIDTYAPGGGFCFVGSVYGPPSDPRVEQKCRWISDEYNRYGRTWYQNH